MVARGKISTVGGVGESLWLTKEEVIALRQHHAEETGALLDPATIT